MKELPHLGIMYPENFPQELIDQDLSELNFEGLRISTRKQENNAYAAMEWVVPTFLATYILKPYFDSFLSEAGKDHYNAVKSQCKKMLSRGKETKAHLISADQSSEKLSGKYNQSLSVSIVFQTKTGRQVKMLFDNNLDLKDWEESLEEFSEFILEHHENFPDDKFSKEIKNLSDKEHYTIYVRINPVSKKLEFHDDLTLISELKK